MNIRYHNHDFLCEYVHSKIVDEKNYFILLDEVQYVNEFEDVYVTGSNAKFLSSDVITEFRGRGDKFTYLHCLLRDILIIAS